MLFFSVTYTADSGEVLFAIMSLVVCSLEQEFTCMTLTAEMKQGAEAGPSNAALGSAVSARYGMPGQTTTAAIQACLQSGRLLDLTRSMAKFMGLSMHQARGLSTLSEIPYCHIAGHVFTACHYVTGLSPAAFVTVKERQKLLVTNGHSCILVQTVV